VQDSNDTDFEEYLKSFSPVAPLALPQTKNVRYRSIRVAAISGAIAAGMAIVLTGVVVSHTRTVRGVERQSLGAASAKDQPPLPPLTVRSANGWLATAPSIGAALDDLAFRSKNAPPPADKKSAIAVLREEKTSL